MNPNTDHGREAAFRPTRGARLPGRHGLGRLLDNVRIALGQIARRPLRNLLVLQGVIWGTALAIWAPGAIEGSRRSAFEDKRTYHLDRIVATPDSATRHSKPFRSSDVEAVREAIGPERLRVISPLDVESATVDAPDGGRLATHLLSVLPDLEEARDFRRGLGRYIEAEDVRQRRRVCVLEPAVAKRLFGDEEALGRRVTLRRADGAELDLSVVGVMEQREQARLGMDALGMSDEKSQELKAMLRWVAGIMGDPGEWERNDLAIHVPGTLVDQAASGYAWIYMRVLELEDLEPCADIVAATLADRGRPSQLFYDASLPFLVGEQLDIYVKLNRAIYLTCVVMGVVVVTIIMLAGVMSRTYEIGIRMVEGATRGDIAFQFMTESGLMCLVGALVGIPAAFLLGEIWLAYELSQFATFILPVKETVLTMMLVVSAGLVAGILPAWRAASLDPIAALRAE